MFLMLIAAGMFAVLPPDRKHWDAAIRDRLSGRAAALQLDGRIHLALSASPTSRVIVGRDGHLFFAADVEPGALSATDPRGLERLHVWTTAFAQRAAWCQRRGIRHLVVIVPEKQRVLPDNFPPSPRLNVGLDLLTALRAVEHAYYRTDTHWTPRGAIIGANATLRALDMRPLDSADYVEETATRTNGDLARMIGLDGALTEQFPAVRFRESEPHATPSNFLPYGWLPHGRAESYRSHHSGPAIVLFGDSLASGTFAEALARRASGLTLIPTYQFDTRPIDSDRPDIVIEQLAERSLLRFSPQPIAD